MPNISFYLQQNVSGTVQVLTGTWVRLTNNSTAATFVSTAASDPNGLITVNSVPAGSYTIATGPTNVGAWTNTGDGNFTVNETDSSNDTTVPGRLVMSTASAKIIAGATRLDIKNSADNKTQIGVPDSGIITFRNAIEVPPSQDASLPTHTYGTIPVKLDEQSGASNANVTLTVPSGGLFRTLEIHLTGRSDNAASQGLAIQMNADAGANYDNQYLTDSNTTITGSAVVLAAVSGQCGVIVASGAPAGSIANNLIKILNADSTTQRKQWQFSSAWSDADTAASTSYRTGWGVWRNTANAITSIKFTPTAGNLVNWRAVLYGWP